MELSVKMDSRSLKDFSEAMQQQVPFATALALTRTATEAKDRVKRELPHRFIIRNQFTSGSIRTQRAEKRDWPEPNAIVGSISPYMELQEEGGNKSPGSKAFSIPKGIRASINKLVPRAKWPGKILLGQQSMPAGGRSKGAIKGTKSKPKPFLRQEQNGVGVYVRAGKGRKLIRLYRLTRQTVHVARLRWLETPTNEVVQQKLESNFVKALEEALKPRV